MDKKFIENPVEAYEKLKQENEILEKVNKVNQEKIKKLNEQLEEEFIAKQYGDEALFFTLMDIKEIAKPYQKDIQNICSNCNNYDDCHACCKFDLNCYQYKKGDTKACDKFIELKEFEINNLANKILNKISEVEDE